MAKRKKRSVQKPVAKRSLPKTFACPYCRAEGTVTCRFRGGQALLGLEPVSSGRVWGQRRVATLECSACHKIYNTIDVDVIDKEVDIYTRWINRVTELRRNGIMCPIGKVCGHKDRVLLRFDPEPLDEDEQRYVTVICDRCGPERIPMLQNETETQARERLKSNTEIRRGERERMMEDHYSPAILAAEDVGEGAEEEPSDDLPRHVSEPSSVDDI